MTKPLFDVFRGSMMRNPTGSRKEAQDHFVEMMKSDPAYLDLLAKDYFERMAAVWTVRQEKHGYSFGRTEVSRDKITRTIKSRVPELLDTPERRTAYLSAAVETGDAEEIQDAITIVTQATVEPSSGNVFTDIGLPDAERLLMEAEQRREQRKESAERTSAAYTALKSKIREVLLLDLELPNGKLLRHATGAECTKAGGFYGEIARHIKPAQVVDRHLTEDKLQDIKARYFQRNAVKAA